MNLKYWEEYYRNETASDFARFCINYMPKQNSLIADIGCGNGRDSYFFGQKGHSVTGFDYAFMPRNTFGVNFQKLSVSDLCKMGNGFDVIYSRFLLHSITRLEIEKLIKWSNGIFMTEFRDREDKPKLFKGHRRNMIDGQWVIELLTKNWFEITYYKRSRGFAKYRGEDPLVVRIIAKKNVSL